MTDGDAISVFVSHSGQDKELAAALVALLRAALPLSARAIRCTSFDGCGLTAGAKTEERLRMELRDASVVIGLLSPTSLKSTFVLFELGARWGLERDFLPVVARGAKLSELRPPLSNRNALSLQQDAHVHQLIGDVAETLHLKPERPEVYYQSMQAVVRLAATVPPTDVSVVSVQPSVDHVVRIELDVPRIVVAESAAELEREQNFHAEIRELAISEATSVRVRYDWQARIENGAECERGFFGHVAFRDKNGYDVARTEISIIRPYRALARSEQTYISFLYLAPEHARFVATVELSLIPIEIKGDELSPATTLEWRGAWPQ
jgi:hypothetical protein